jgi:hypothetical protein
LCCILAASNVHLWRWSGTFMEASSSFSAATWIIYYFACIKDDFQNNKVVQYGLLGLSIGLLILLVPVHLP